MKEYLSEVEFKTLEEMTVISGKKVSKEPENEIIDMMTKFVKENGLEFGRVFGFDSPVDEEDMKKGYRGYECWISVNDENISELVEGTDFVVKSVPSYKYICLRITDPFVDPIGRIQNGWKMLVDWLEENEMACDIRNEKKLNCLEEIGEENGITFMDIYIPIDKA